MRRARLCRAVQKDSVAGRASCCFCAKWGKGARPNRQAPCYFLGDGTKGWRAKHPPEQAGPLLFLRGRCKGPEGKAPAGLLPFRHVYPAFCVTGALLFRARPGGGQPVKACGGASGPGPARQTADKPPARAQTPPRRNRRLSAGTSAYPAHS